MRSWIIITGILVMPATTSLASARGTIHNITQDTYPATIQAAIDDATGGDVIEVGPGTYLERINLHGKAIALRSTDGPDTTIIDGSAAGTVVTCADGEGPDTIIQGFTITNGSASNGGGMYNDGASPTIFNCVFVNNLAIGPYSTGDGGAMYNFNSSSPTVTNCIFTGNSANRHGGAIGNGYAAATTLIDCSFTGNSATTNGGAIYNGGDANTTLLNCSFTGNSAGQNGGAMYNGESSPSIVNCTFTGNSADSGGAIYSLDFSRPTLTNCIVWNNTANTGSQILDLDNGLNWTATTLVSYSCIQGGWLGTGNIDADPLFVDADGPDDTFGTSDDDLHLQEGSPCINSGNDFAVPVGLVTDFDGESRIQHYQVDMGVDETPYAGEFADCNSNGIADELDIFVGTSQDLNGDGIPDECGTVRNTTQETIHSAIQEAIDAANHGDEIEVGPGTYFERINPLGKAITLRSTDGPEATIINGCANGSVVTCTSGEGTGTIIEGFTIANGKDFQGGGMYNSSSSPTVNNCTFIGSSARGTSGFSFAFGGGMYNNNCNPVITDCRFIDNYAEYNGGGMYNHASSPTITNCTFTAHVIRPYGDWLIAAGAGMYNNGGSNPTLTNCTFTDNHVCITSTTYSLGGGMCNVNSSPTLIDCTFTANSSGYLAGAMYNTSSNPSLTNCTFSQNSAYSTGGAIYNAQASDPVLAHCSFNGNSAESYSGGAMVNVEESAPTMISCTFSNNTAVKDGGAIYNWSAHATMANCTFTGNSADDRGGAIHSDNNSALTAVNCTLTGNSAGSGGAIHSEESTPILANCILWANTASPGPQILDGVDSSTTATYCCIQNGWPGTGNIDADPLFGDADGPDNIYGTPDDDLRLLAGSPCIDAAENATVPPDTYDLDDDGNTTEPLPFDLDNRPRFWDDPNTTDTGAGTPPIIDMGAYEYHGAPGDCDGDGVVDLHDLDTLTDCLAGPGDTDGDCWSSDLDYDNDVDLNDFAIFQTVFN